MARFARIAAPLLVVAVVYAGWLDRLFRVECG